MASTGQSPAASLTAFSCSGGTFGLITSATSLPILKTSGTLSTHRPQLLSEEQAARVGKVAEKYGILLKNGKQIFEHA